MIAADQRNPSSTIRSLPEEIILRREDVTPVRRYGKSQSLASRYSVRAVRVARSRNAMLGRFELSLDPYEGKELRYAAKVRAGFTPHVRRDVFERIRGLETAKCPFADLPTMGPSRRGGGIPAEEMGEFTWLKPHAVAQVRFVEWTADGHLRHSAFLGLRTDEVARGSRRET